MAGKGKPRKFTTEQDFLNAFIEYIDDCREKNHLANIAGFCVFCDMCRDTYYAQKEHYPYTFKRVEQILEDYTINYKGDSPAFKIFYMKNKFDYKDRFENENFNRTIDVVIGNDFDTESE